MPALIKIDKYDKRISNILYLSYFVHQFTFVISASAFAKTIPLAYKIISAFMIFSFLIMMFCDLYYLLRGMFNKKEIIIYSIISIVLLISFYNYRSVMVLANIVAVSVFKNTDGIKAIKYYLLATCLGFFVNLLLALFTQYTGNMTAMRNGVERVRYGLGFLYGNLPPFYYLSIVLAYFIIKKQVSAIEYIAIFIINLLLFISTDTKAPFMYVTLLIILHIVLFYAKSELIYKLFGYITIVSYPLFFLITFLLSLFYNSNNKLFVIANRIVNNRLRFTKSALDDYGFALFGKTSPIVFETVNQHVDSSFVSMIMLHGVIVLIICILFMTYFSYISYKTKKTTLLLALFFMAARATFDMGFMAMQLSPFIILFMPVLREYCLAKDKL